VFVPDQEYTINKQILMMDLGIKPDAAVVDINESNTFYDLTEGWLIHIPSGSITYQSGKVYSGKLKIEYLSISDYDLNLLQAPSTWSGQDPLAVKRMFYYKLSLEEIGLKIDQPIFLIKSEAQEGPRGGMVLSYDKDKKDWVEADQKMRFSFDKWTVAENEGSREISGFRIPILTDEQWTLSFDSNDNNYYYDKNIHVKLPQQFNSKNTIALLFSLENKQLLKLNGNKNNSTFTADKYRFDAKSNYRILTFSDLGEGGYYFGMTNVLESKITYNIVIESVSKEELIKRLSEL